MSIYVRNGLFAKAIDYLYKEGLVADQCELSKKTGITETSISRILNDRVKKPSDVTVRKLNEAFGNIFNPAYFRGENVYMLISDVVEAQQAEKEKAAIPPYDEKAAHNNLIEILARTIRGVDDLRVQLQQELAEVRALKEELRQLTHRPIVYMNNEQKIRLSRRT